MLHLKTFSDVGWCLCGCSLPQEPLVQLCQEFGLLWFSGHLSYPLVGWNVFGTLSVFFRTCMWVIGVILQTLQTLTWTWKLSVGAGKARGDIEESISHGSNNHKKLSVQMWAVEIYSSGSDCTTHSEWTYCAGQHFTKHFVLFCKRCFLVHFIYWQGCYEEIETDQLSCPGC